MRIDVTPKKTAAETVRQSIYTVDKKSKPALLCRLILDGDWKQVLVFTRTKHGANRLAEKLERNGIQSAAIHGNKSQGARTRALSGFKEGKVRALVATDIAARGLDIEQLPRVVNFELPNVPEDYVHRIGRTGRAGAEGYAVSLVSADERDLLRGIEKLLKTSIPAEVMQGFEPGPEDVSENQSSASRNERSNRSRRPARSSDRNRSGNRTANNGSGRSSGARPAASRSSGGRGDGRGRR